MLSTAALRARVASIIDALSRTAVAEIARVVEDGMAVLRLEMCRRENEIKTLKSNVELLHMELRAAQQRLNLAPDPPRRDDSQRDKRSVPAAQELRVKREPAEEATCARAAGRPDPCQWSSTQNESRRNDSCNTVRKRTVKRLLLKKGYICPFCGKCFERAGHLERHKRIHTGEKPYGCETCGRRFNQKCSLKEHTKIHGRRTEPGPAEAPSWQEGQVPEDDGQAKGEGCPPSNRVVVPAAVQVKSEPEEESVTRALHHHEHVKEEAGQNRPGRSAQLLPAPAELPRSTFSFPGKPYGEVLNGEAPDQHVKFETLRPKRFFACSYCGKVFERSGHLERHLRIHTGEKPYGCHLCGRCFNQNSSLKGHMKTHRKGETTAVPEGHQLMVTVPENQPNARLTAFREQPPGYSEEGGGQTVTVKVEPMKQEVQTEGPAGPGAGPGAPDQSRGQLWTSAAEGSTSATDPTPCALLQDVKFLGPANEPQGCTSPVHKLPFTDDKDEPMLGEQLLVVGMQSGASGVTPELQDLCVVKEARDCSPDRTREGAAFEFKIITHEDAAGQHGFICSRCGQSFDGFDLFQVHRCKSVAEPCFSCHTCGEVFNHVSVLRLHLKLHED